MAGPGAIRYPQGARCGDVGNYHFAISLWGGFRSAPDRFVSQLLEGFRRAVRLGAEGRFFGGALLTIWIYVAEVRGLRIFKKRRATSAITGDAIFSKIIKINVVRFCYLEGRSLEIELPRPLNLF